MQTIKTAEGGKVLSTKQVKAYGTEAAEKPFESARHQTQKTYFTRCRN